MHRLAAVAQSEYDCWSSACWDYLGLSLEEVVCRSIVRRGGSGPRCLARGRGHVLDTAAECTYNA